MLTEHQYKAADLSRAQREVLIVHALGPQPVQRSDVQRSDNGRTGIILMRRGLIRYTGPDGKCGGSRPTHTLLTEDGRQVVCAILAEYADALVASAEFLKTIKAPMIAEAGRERVLAKLLAE